MADYHIYLHTDAPTSSGNQTKPFQNKETTGGEDNFLPKASQVYGTAKGIVGGNGLNMGVAALSKVAPWVAVVVAIAKVGDKVLSTGFAHQEEYKGNYKNNVNYNNFKSMLGATFNPVGVGYSLIKQQYEIEKYNLAIQQQNKLIGNSILQNMKAGY